MASERAVDKTPVISADEMDDVTFARHMTKRHPESLGGLTRLEPYPQVLPVWRTFHSRLHNLRQMDISHVHIGKYPSGG